VHPQRFTSKVFLAFLERLIKSVKHKVYLIVDGHPTHKASIVKKWLAAHDDAIRRFLLPSYSPELNPDELLNNDVKSNALGRCRPHCQDEMIGDVRAYLRSTQKRRDIVRNYFRAPSVQYAMD